MEISIGNDKLLSELSAEQRAKIQQKVEQKVASNIQKVQQQQESIHTGSASLGLNIRKADDSSGREATKRVKVRILPTDTMGAAPLPEGYLAKKKSLNPSSSAQANAPIALSYHDRVRIAQETMPYTAPQEKTAKKILR